MERKRDYLFFLYFVTHIPITVLLDSQFVLPKWLYPDELLEVADHFVTTYRDPMLGGLPSWFLSLCFCELFLQLPFFFLASHVYCTGVSKHKWMRIPMTIYSSHVITTMVPIFSHLVFEDFSKEDFLVPRTSYERLTLSAFYFPYLLVPVLLLIDTLFCAGFSQSEKNTDTLQSAPEFKRKQL